MIFFIKSYLNIIAFFLTSIAFFAIIYNRLEPGKTLLDDLLFSFNIQTLLGLELNDTTVKSMGKKVVIMIQLMVSWLIAIYLLFIHRN